ncbi:MAG TPA: SRPBCC family protein [Candidatus Polarisedimenticolia bacterium]|nr:SRPBCC family protein [Candidatus Polarisedimenticolia bacterium]
MSLARAARSGVVRAPARAVYALIADYRHGHPRMLPPQYFPKLDVERGGTGAGTIIRFQVRLAGVTREIRAEITEPTPGQVLVETDLATGARTTFTVTADGGEACKVTIETEWDAKGLRGWVERMTAPRLLQRIYAEQLAMLAGVAEGIAGGKPAGPHDIRRDDVASR